MEQNTQRIYTCLCDFCGIRKMINIRVKVELVVGSCSKCEETDLNVGGTDVKLIDEIGYEVELLLKVICPLAGRVVQEEHNVRRLIAAWGGRHTCRK